MIITITPLINPKHSNMNLYLLTTEGLGDFYLVANNPLEAQKKLEGELNKADYGFDYKRKVKVIKHLAEELKDSFGQGELNFSSKNNLIITEIERLKGLIDDLLKVGYSGLEVHEQANNIASQRIYRLKAGTFPLNQ